MAAMPEPYSRHRRPIRLSLGELTHRRLADLAERLEKSRSQVVDDAVELLADRMTKLDEMDPRELYLNLMGTTSEAVDAQREAFRRMGDSVRDTFALLSARQQRLAALNPDRSLIYDGKSVCWQKDEDTRVVVVADATRYFEAGGLVEGAHIFGFRGVIDFGRGEATDPAS